MRWLNEFSQQFLEQDYLLPGQSVEQRIDIIAQRAESILEFSGYANKFKENMAKGWYSLSTPVWTNFGTNRALPISCFSSYIDDHMTSILDALSEVGMMTKYGGGTSAYFGNLRPRGSKIGEDGQSSGGVHFMQLFDTLIQVVSQGSVRRGSFAAYLPIDHGDIEEFLQIRKEGHPLQHIWFGVTVTDQWMNEMISGDSKKREIWAKVLEARTDTGGPYIFFVDNANRGAPDVYRDNNMEILSSNLCCEISLPLTEDESFVCDLSSMNILYYDEWKNTDAVEILVYLLDAVMTEFIDKAKTLPHMERAVRFAENHRALGVGWLGWHSYLQSKMIAFESFQARALNIEIAQLIQKNALKASQVLAKEKGSPPLLEPYKRRNTTLTAIAPTKSSAFILGQVSEGIEPARTNYYIKDLQKGKFTIKNEYLTKLLQEKNIDSPEIWKDILIHGGSVQHLQELSKEEKEVFKTFGEIAPKEIIIQAAQRQLYIDQGQSLNLMIHPSLPIKEVNQLLIDAWRLGIKGFYYQIGVNAAQSFSRQTVAEAAACSIEAMKSGEECLACQ